MPRPRPSSNEKFPQYAALIAAWSERFGETISGPVPGVHALVEELDARGVPLFAITNFSADFWPPFHDAERAFFARFRDIIVSGEVKLLKPDPAIYYLALDRFGLRPADALFVDDREINVEGALAVGMEAHLFTDADGLRARLEAEGLCCWPEICRASASIVRSPDHADRQPGSGKTGQGGPPRRFGRARAARRAAASKRRRTPTRGNAQDLAAARRRLPRPAGSRPPKRPRSTGCSKSSRSPCAA